MTRFCTGYGLSGGKTKIPPAFISKTMSVEDKVIEIQVWAPSGQERYGPLPPLYYRGAAGALLLYDITQYKTFVNAEKWLEQLRSNTDANIVIMLVGNKSDLQALRAVSYEEATAFAGKHGTEFIETSALDSSNIDLAFEKLGTGIYQNLKKRGASGDENAIKIKEDVQKEKGGCC